MKTDWTSLEPFRERRGDFATNPGDHFGLFVVGLNGQDIAALCIASDGTGSDDPGNIPPELLGWEHVSVSIRERPAATTSIIVPGRLRQRGAIRQRIPTWDEMQAIKRLFWDDSETCIQFHPMQSQYVNKCEFCLHIWRRIGVNMELPPAILVA